MPAPARARLVCSTATHAITHTLHSQPRAQGAPPFPSRLTSSPDWHPSSHLRPLPRITTSAQRHNHRPLNSSTRICCASHLHENERGRKQHSLLAPNSFQHSNGPRPRHRAQLPAAAGVHYTTQHRCACMPCRSRRSTCARCEQDLTARRTPRHGACMLHEGRGKCLQVV